IGELLRGDTPSSNAQSCGTFLAAGQFVLTVWVAVPPPIRHGTKPHSFPVKPAPARGHADGCRGNEGGTRRCGFFAAADRRAATPIAAPDWRTGCLAPA